MADRIAAIALSVLAVATITTLVLPGRQTPAVITAGGSSFAKIINAAIGRA